MQICGRFRAAKILNSPSGKKTSKTEKPMVFVINH